MQDEPVAEVLFLGGIMRSVYIDGDGRQYVLDDDGERAYWVWLHPDRWPEPDVLVNLPDYRSAKSTVGLLVSRLP